MKHTAPKAMTLCVWLGEGGGSVCDVVWYGIEMSERTCPFGFYLKLLGLY